MRAISEDLASPVVNKDRSVTFNLKSECARTVEVSEDFVFGKELHVLDARTPMEKGSDNVWTLTSVPMLPGTYGYMYQIISGEPPCQKNINYCLYARAGLREDML